MIFEGDAPGRRDLIVCNIESADIDQIISLPKQLSEADIIAFDFSDKHSAAVGFNGGQELIFGIGHKITSFSMEIIAYAHRGAQGSGCGDDRVQ